MKILVTGGSGFIGSHIVEALLKNKHEIIVVDNLSTGFKDNLKEVMDQITFVEGNAANEELMMEQLKGVDCVSHQAALTSVPRSMKNPMETFKETMTASVVTLECARQRNVKRFVFAASSSVYGNRSEKIKTEDLYPKPISPYAAAKTALEFYASAYAAGFGMTTVGLRYFNVFGPRQDPLSDYAAVIPLFIKKFMNNEAPTITGDGDQSRDFTYVANVVSANVLAIESELAQESFTMNVATGVRVTLPELVETLADISGKDIKAVYGPERPGDVKHSLADIKKAKDVLGYKPLVDFKEGLSHTWEYAKEFWAS